MMRSIANPLSDYFLSSHKRVVQFAVGVHDGAAKAIHSITSLLPSPPPTPADADLLDEIDSERRSSMPSTAPPPAPTTK
eukprot:2922392-Rhodomonas_salina.1